MRTSLAKGVCMRHFLTLRDFSPHELLDMLALALNLKREFKSGVRHTHLAGKILGMVFEKNSTRTRVSFEAGIYQLGGMGIFLSHNDIQLSRGESIPDSARVISSMVDLLMIRTFEQERLEEFAKYSRVSVMNGLSNSYHPLQAMADYMTLIEHGIFNPKNQSHPAFLDAITQLGLKCRAHPRLVYIGDGNNMANSYMMLACALGLELRIVTPVGYEPKQEIINLALKLGERNTREFNQEFSIDFFHDPKEAVQGANVILTDTWVSMGEEESREKKEKDFAHYCVNEELLDLASDDVLFLHCLPAYRGKEVSSGVIDGPRSCVFQEAENRLHIQKGIMLWLYQNQNN